MIYDLKSDKAFCLNQTAAHVWRTSDGERTVTEIADGISDESGAKASDEVVWLALDQLKQNNLLSNENEIRGPFANLSRREVIRKIGLSTAVALPMVLALVAPKSIVAQTTCAPLTGGCTCATQANGGGANGAVCGNVLTACANPSCRCIKANNSGNPGSGNCVP